MSKRTPGQKQNYRKRRDRRISLGTNRTKLEGEAEAELERLAEEERSLWGSLDAVAPLGRGDNLTKSR